MKCEAKGKKGLTHSLSHLLNTKSGESNSLHVSGFIRYCTVNTHLAFHYKRGKNKTVFLGAFAKLRKASISYMSVSFSVYPH
jgi:arabinogalactan endo-1,4-beta-galactosidase